MGKYKKRAMTGRIASQRQLQKFKDLLAQGSISQETYDNWINQTQGSLSDTFGGLDSLPERSPNVTQDEED